MDTNLLEVVWTLSAFVGGFAAFLGVIDAQTDKEAVKVLGLNGRRQLLAKQSFRYEIQRFSMMLVFFIIGVVAMFSIDENQAMTIEGIIISTGLIGISLMSTFNSFYDRRTRRKYHELTKDSNAKE